LTGSCRHDNLIIAMDKFIDGKPVEEEGKEEPKEEKSPLAKMGGASDEEIVKELKLRPFRDYFKVGSDKDEMLLYIVSFFGKEAKEPELVIQKIREAEGKLAKGPFEGRIERLYRYTRLINTIRNEVAEL